MVAYTLTKSGLEGGFGSLSCCGHVLEVVYDGIYCLVYMILKVRCVS